MAASRHLRLESFSKAGPAERGRGDDHPRTLFAAERALPLNACGLLREGEQYGSVTIFGAVLGRRITRIASAETPARFRIRACARGGRRSFGAPARGAAHGLSRSAAAYRAR